MVGLCEKLWAKAAKTNTLLEIRLRQSDNNTDDFCNFWVGSNKLGSINLFAHFWQNLHQQQPHAITKRKIE